MCMSVFQRFTDSAQAQCRLSAWTHWAPGGPMLIYICCVRHISSCLNTGFVRSSNSMNIHACLILSTICIFIPVSGGHKCTALPGGL